MDPYKKATKGPTDDTDRDLKKLTWRSSVYASGQSLNEKMPIPRDQRAYEPNETRSHHGNCSHEKSFHQSRPKWVSMRTTHHGDDLLHYFLFKKRNGDDLEESQKVKRWKYSNDYTHTSCASHFVVEDVLNESRPEIKKGANGVLLSAK